MGGRGGGGWRSRRIQWPEMGTLEWAVTKQIQWKVVRVRMSCIPERQDLPGVSELLLSDEEASRGRLLDSL